MKAVDKNQFQSHLLWNFSSLFFIGIGGFFLNVLIARLYGAEALGVFNQVLAYYLIISQACVGGLAFSTLRFTSRYARRNKIYTSILNPAICIALITSLFAAIFSWWLAPFFASFLQSPFVENGVKCVTPGLLAFSINKIIFAALNGSRQMKAYAVGQSVRYILFISVLSILIQYEVQPQYLPILFSISEIILLIGLFIYSYFSTGIGSIDLKSSWWKRHINYGIRAWLIGLMMDLNTKVDILMLGYFVDDRTVGIYAFAVLFVEALMQLVFVVQNNYNPILAKLEVKRRIKGLYQMIRQVYLYFFPVVLISIMIISILFPWLSYMVTNDTTFQMARLYFVIISSFILLVSGILPFNMVINQFGQPGRFTLFILCTVVINVILNVSLIPLYGAVGAAFATGIAFLAQAPLLWLFLRKTI